MALKLFYYGQNIGTTVPDVVLTGNPALDQPALSAAGYLGGKIMAISTSSNLPASVVIVPCDADTAVPFGTLINDPGEFAGAIGPSGSGKAPVVRAMWFGAVDSVAFDANATFTLGDNLYCGGTTHTNIGKYTSSALKGTNSPAVGICTAVPGQASFYGPGSWQYGGTNNWLGVASLI